MVLTKSIKRQHTVIEDGRQNHERGMLTGWALGEGDEVQIINGFKPEKNILCSTNQASWPASFAVGSIFNGSSLGGSW